MDLIKFRYCNVSISHGISDREAVGSYDGKLITLYFSDNQLPVLNVYFDYDLDLKEISNNSYLVKRFNGMFVKPNTNIENIRSTINESSLIESYYFIKENFKVTEDAMYAVLFKHRLRLLRILSNENHFLSKVSNEELAELYDAFVLNNEEVLNDFDEYGPELFKNYKIRESHLTLDMRVKLGHLIDLSRKARENNIFVNDKEELSVYMKNCLKNLDIRSYKFMDVDKSINNKFEKLNDYIYLKKGKNHLVVLEPYKVDIFEILKIVEDKPYKVNLLGCINPNPHLVTPFSLYNYRLYSKEFPQHQIKIEGTIETINDLIECKNCLILYNFYNSHLINKYYEAMNKKFQISETFWDGIVTNFMQLISLSGQIVKCISSKAPGEKGQIYFVKMVLNYIELHCVKTGNVYAIYNLKTNRPSYKLATFMNLKQYCPRLHKNCKIILNSDIDNDWVNNLNISVKKLKLFK